MIVFASFFVIVFCFFYCSVDSCRSFSIVEAIVKTLTIYFLLWPLRARKSDNIAVEIIEKAITNMESIIELFSLECDI